jgi:hypothetical protein
MSTTNEAQQKAELIAKARQALEQSKALSSDEFFRPLIDKGIIDENGQVIVDMKYAMPLSNGSQNGQRNGKDEHS